MKTKVMQDKKYRYDVLLTVSGWGLAIFVSFLYLNDTNSPLVVHERPHPVEKRAPVTVARTDRVDSLLLESRVLLSRNRPIETINRITTLWSVCHSTQQDVPEESHRLFAQAVSLLSRNRSVNDKGLSRPEPLEKAASNSASDFAEIEDEARPVKPVEPSSAKKEPKFALPTPDYPRAKADSKGASSRYPKAKRTSKLPLPPPPVTSEDGGRPPAFPPPPAQESDGRLPAPPPPPNMERPGPPPGSRAGSFPPPPPPPGAPGPGGERRGPLDAGNGGPPPGYYY